MTSPYGLQSPAASAASPTWWTLMENSDCSDDDEHQVVVQRKLRLSHHRSRPFGSPSTYSESYGYNSPSRRTSAPLPLNASSPLSRRPSSTRRKSLGTSQVLSHHHHTSPRRPLSTPRRSLSDKYKRQSFSDTPPTRKSSEVPSPRLNSSLGPSLDEEDSPKKIRWEKPTTHRYQKTKTPEQPRLLEEKFLNAIDTIQPSVFCAQNFQKPLIAGGTMMWSLLESGNQQGNGKKKDEKNCDVSQDQSSDESDDSVFEDGPSVVEISAHPPVFSSSITASESLLSSSQESDEDDIENNESEAHEKVNDAFKQAKGSAIAPADSSQILDDLSCMESRKLRVVEYDNEPHKLEQNTIVVNGSKRPPVKIYSTSLPFESGTKDKSCLVSLVKLQEMHKSRSGSGNGKAHFESKRRPPVPDITFGDSNEISTMSASEDSHFYHSRGKVQEKLGGGQQARNGSARRSSLLDGTSADTRSQKIEPDARLIFGNSFQDEPRTCIPFHFQRMRKNIDGGTATSSSMSLGRRLFSRSGDANTTSEKENKEGGPYDYEYATGMNTYVAYFETSKSTESQGPLQLIEHPNPPMLPFGSNEVVVKIEASTISQSDCAIRRGEWWGGTLSLPRIPGVAFVGTIDQIHKAGRSNMQIGDRVLSLVCSGSNSRYVCIPRDRLVKVPSYLNQPAPRIACLPEIYLSAFQALHQEHNNGARYRKNSLLGKSIMFAGGASAFGQAIIELGLNAGASVVYVTASKVKQFQRVIELGGIPLSNNPEEWSPSINQQVDILIGCTNETLRDIDPFSYDHLNVLKKKGSLVLLEGPGSPADYPVIYPGKNPCQVDALKILRNAHTHNVFESWERDMKQGKRDLLHLLGLLHKNVLNPKVLERIALNKVSKAEDIVETRRLHGVIVCEPWIKQV